MKKIKKTIASVLVLVFALFLTSAVMVACSDDEPPGPEPGGIGDRTAGRFRGYSRSHRQLHVACEHKLYASRVKLLSDDGELPDADDL